MFRKVIRSHVGEVTQDIRTVGDRVRYRIYYGGGRQLPTNQAVTLTDKVDRHLEDVKALNRGVFNPGDRTITWTIRPVPVTPVRRNPYVEFEAVVAGTGVITNQAVVRTAALRPVKSNTVTTTVTAAPRLGWIPLAPDVSQGQAPVTYLKDETTTGITVRFDLPGIFIREERVDGVAYERVSIPARAATTEVGKPELPVIGEMIEVPFDVDFSTKVVKAETIRLDGYNIHPAQVPRVDAGRSYPFTLDEVAYRTDADYPAAPVSIAAEDIGVIRGHRVLLLKVHPVLVNPVTRVLTVHTTLEIRIDFDHTAQVRGVPKRLQSRHFEELLAASVLNFKDQERFAEGPDDGPGPEQEGPACDYLIITEDAFYDPAVATNPVRRLAEWKRQKGYRTNVVKVSTIPGGNTAAAIQSYLKTAYETWSAPPSYVLLVGDADLVSPAEGHDHPDEADPDHPMPQVNTDLNHVTVDGTDYFPDIYIGRLPAQSNQQVSDMVDKILTYEQNPPTNAGFYDNISLAGLFTETDEDPAVITGQEDRPWIANMESIRDFLQGQGYAVERIYATDTGFPGNPAAQAPLRFHDGTNLPNDLRHPQYGWDGGTNEIRTAINAGRFLVAYRAHGHWSGWSGPSFGNAQANALTQNDLTPLVVSITCQTGWHDNEIDDDAHGGRAAGDDCFAEVMMRRPRSGAVGLIGMSRNSWTGNNDFLVFGAIKAIWPGFNPNPHWAGHPAAPPGDQVALRRLGQITNFSKMYMARAYAHDEYRRCEFEMHHLFGDPEMPLWTEVPGELTVDYPKGIGAVGLQEFVVSVTDRVTGQAVHNATVVLTRGGEIVQMRQTHTDGVAEFGLTAVGDGELGLTVTALGYRPHLGQLEVTTDGGQLDILDPDNGPEEQVVAVGGLDFAADEDVEIHFGSQPPMIVHADASGEFGQAAPAVELTVPAGHPHQLVNVYACGVTSQRKAVRVFQVRDKNPVDLWMYDQWNSATWTAHPGDNPTWNNPDIQLFDAANNPVDSSSLVVGEAYKVRATVRNSAAFDAAHANVVYQWENYGAGGPWQAFATPFVSIDVPADPPGTATAEDEFIPWVTGHVCVLVTLEHPEDLDTTNNSGQENLHVGSTSSPAEVCFTVWNRTHAAGPVFFEVRQLSGSGAGRVLWSSWVRHPDPQILQPGDEAKACVLIDPLKADVPHGARAEFAVTCFIGKEMIGGVNVNIAKK